MIHVQTGNMLDVVVEGKSIGLKQRDSDHRKYEIIWLPAPEGLRDVLAAEIKRLKPAESPVVADEAERQAREIVDSCTVKSERDEEIGQGRVFVTAAHETLVNRIAAALHSRPVEQAK